jgi:hypothetical protein
MDWTALEAAVDFTDALGFIGVAAVAVIGVLIALKGISLGKRGVK